ncbi:hypothetical protein [Teichococcus vastitatis]|jgi:hypothetical protein|uniref:Uncharacterized protein n=1 Tax=Teichococcus vastitatis TaxID=2307076 RepID=A0ABS9W4H0_9PROT|nr:hypothetical protein [Pseudoroseomonas vastitatis]MCI0754184.1 hypothetical protein [Pseudoroseomonas vastitatis]
MAAKEQVRLSEGQRAYEAKRAAKAGVSLEKWLSMKAQDREKLAAATAKAAEPAKKQGFLARLLERAQRPIG